MTSKNPHGEDKKIPIVPRALGAFPPEEESGQVTAEKKTVNKLAYLLKQTGVPFDARAESRPRTPREEQDSSGGKKPDSTEFGASTGASAENETSSPANKMVIQTWKWIRKGLRKHVRVKWALLAGLPVVVVFSWGFFSWGAFSQRRQMLAAMAKQRVNIPADFQPRLDKALSQLRAGDARKALDQLLLLEHEAPAVSSLTYLVALASVRAGDMATASAKADQSVAKRERISDSLALKAVLETQNPSGSTRGGDPRVRAETYLRQAMIEDEANPFPYVELATLLRSQKRDEEAMRLLEGARARLNPVDSHAVVDATIALLNLQNLPDNELPENINPDKDVAALFSTAYIAMRKGGFARAAALLATARDRLPADLYHYLVNDPAMRNYARQPEVAGFF